MKVIVKLGIDIISTAKMKFFFKNIIVILLAISVFACNQKPAKVLNKSKNVYNQQIIHKVSKVQAAPIAPIVGNLQNNSLDNRVVEVVAGDTLFSVSKKYQVTLRDLIKHNNLVPPYDLKVGSKIFIPKPNYHEVKTGETIYSISRIYNMKINQLIEMNDLKEPYAIKLGEKLRVSEVTQNIASQKVVAPIQSEKPAVTSSVVEKNNDLNKNNLISAAKVNKINDSNLAEKILDRKNNFSWPIKGEIISNFGPKKGGLYNDGINIRAKEGQMVKASEDGVIAYVGNELKGYGNLVIVKHPSGFITAYAHLKNSAVTRGQKVKKGEKIGLVGSTGNVDFPQLYFGLRKGRDALNPQNYLK